MRKFKNVRDDALLRRTAAVAARSHGITAELLEHLAEIDTRRLYLALGYDCMKAYCVGELHFSDGAARRRVYAANVIRTFPVILQAIARGRLHLSAVIQIAPHLTQANAEDLIAAVTHKGRPEIDLELARRFPQAEVMRLDDGISPQVVVPQRLDVEACTPACMPPEPKPVRTKLAPITVERYTLQVTIDAETHDELRELQDLLGQSAVADVLKECVHLRLLEVKKRKFAQVERPRRSQGTRRPRGISAQVKRAVHARDGDRCAYVGTNGHRCNSRKELEYDHIIPVAMGGKSTVENVRLVCRIHNQFAADQVFGKKFMDAKRLVFDDGRPVGLPIDEGLPLPVDLHQGFPLAPESEFVMPEIGPEAGYEVQAGRPVLRDDDRVPHGDMDWGTGVDDRLPESHMGERAPAERIGERLLNGGVGPDG